MHNTFVQCLIIASNIENKDISKFLAIFVCPHITQFLFVFNNFYNFQWACITIRISKIFKSKFEQNLTMQLKKSYNYFFDYPEHSRAHGTSHLILYCSVGTSPLLLYVQCNCEIISCLFQVIQVHPGNSVCTIIIYTTIIKQLHNISELCYAMLSYVNLFTLTWPNF